MYRLLDAYSRRRSGGVLISTDPYTLAYISKLPTRYLLCRHAHSTLDHGGAETLHNTYLPRPPRVPITTTNTNPPLPPARSQGLNYCVLLCIDLGFQHCKPRQPGSDLLVLHTHTHTYTGPRANLSSSFALSLDWILSGVRAGQGGAGRANVLCYVARGRAPTGRYQVLYTGHLTNTSSPETGGVCR